MLSLPKEAPDPIQPVESFYNQLLNVFVTKNFERRCATEHEKIGYKTFIQTLVQTYLFEPANFSSHMTANNQTTNFYVNGKKPNSLHPYNVEFRRTDDAIQIIPGCLDVDYCVGICDSTGHVFLKHEGSFKCNHCCRSICITCKFEEVNEAGEKKIYCSNCFKEEILSPDSSNNTTNTLTNIYISRETMRAALATVGTEVLATDNYVDVNDLYDALVENNGAVYDGRILSESVTIPEKPSSFLNTMHTITSFDIRNGGRYIHDDNLSTRQIIEITKLLASLVMIEQMNNNTRNNETYHVLPKMIIEFVKKSRVNSGYRLCKRAVRHALDAQANHIFNAKI